MQIHRNKIKPPKNPQLKNFIHLYFFDKKHKKQSRKVTPAGEYQKEKIIL